MIGMMSEHLLIWLFLFFLLKNLSNIRFRRSKEVVAEKRKRKDREISLQQICGQRFLQLSASRKEHKWKHKTGSTQPCSNPSR